MNLVQWLARKIVARNPDKVGRLISLLMSVLVLGLGLYALVFPQHGEWMYLVAAAAMWLVVLL